MGPGVSPISVAGEEGVKDRVWSGEAPFGWVFEPLL
jgi:hypothetical protein